MADRIRLVVDEAIRVGARRSAEPALAIWASVLLVDDTDDSSLMESIAAMRRNVERLEKTLKLVSPATLTDCRLTIDGFLAVLSIEKLSEPWHNFRRYMSDEARIALRACSAALEERFDEHVLDVEQIEFAKRMLVNFIDQIDQSGLPQHITDFLKDSLIELRRRLVQISRLGVEEFTLKADHFLAQLQRLELMASGGQHESAVKRVVKSIGVGIASLTAAVTLAGGVNSLDEETIKLLPWHDSVDKGAVQVIIEGGPHVPGLTAGGGG